MGTRFADPIAAAPSSTEAPAPAPTLLDVLAKERAVTGLRVGSAEDYINVFGQSMGRDKVAQLDGGRELLKLQEKNSRR